MLKKSSNRFDISGLKIFKHSENGVFYFRVTDNKSTGIGVSTSEQIAFKKAFFEKIEREYSSTFATSNGCAAHTLVTNAEINAYNETIERHLFLSYWKSRSRNIDIPKFLIKFLVPRKVFELISIKCERNRTTFSVKLLGFHNDRYFVSGVVCGTADNVGALFSSNNGRTLKEAVSNLFLDFARSLWMIESNMNSYASRWQGLPKDIATRDDHFFFFLNPRNRNYWAWYLKSGFRFSFIRKQVPTTYQILSAPANQIPGDGLPFIVIRAENKFTEILKFGFEPLEPYHNIHPYT